MFPLSVQKNRKKYHDTSQKILKKYIFLVNVFLYVSENSEQKNKFSFAELKKIEEVNQFFLNTFFVILKIS